MDDVRLDDQTFLLYAARHYTNLGSGGLEEFTDDLARLKHLRRLCRRYTRTGDLKERLILNHLICLTNTFEARALVRMVAYRLFEFLEIIKPFLQLLGHWPQEITKLGFEQVTVRDADVISDPVVVERLATI